MSGTPDAPDAKELADVVGITVAEADERIAAMIGGLTWSNLTRPLIDQMRASPHAWRALANIAMVKHRTRGKGQGAEWGPTCPAGSLRLRINPSGGIRCGVAIRSGPSTVGPDDLNGRALTIANVSLPETVLMSIRGRRLDEIVHSERHLALVPGDTPLRTASGTPWSVKLTLALPFIQPSDADLAAIRAANDPSAAH